MSENEKQDSTENDCESDDEQIDNLEVETAISDKTIQVSHGSSRITNDMLQQLTTKGTEVHSDDVIIIEQLSDESLENSSSESLDCKVTYEFPNEEERENTSFSEGKECKVSYESLNGHESQKVSHLSAACAVPEHKITRVYDHVRNRPVPEFDQKPEDKLKVFVPKTRIEVYPDDASTAGASRESERKRKKDSISLLQNKRAKETETSDTPEIYCVCDNDDIRQDENSENSSGEFADIEDNVKNSSSSENSDSNTTTKTAILMSMKYSDAGIPQRNERKNESLDKNGSMKVNYEASSSNSNNSPNTKSSDKAAKERLFPSTLKGETIPAIKLSDDMKEKFKISMPTILEVRESESDEQILQPRKSNSNPLIMKTSVVKRKDRCNVCNAKLGLCAIKCRCGGYYCSKHRYDKEHNCTFDYKSMGAAEIQKNNPKIVAAKVRKL